MGTSSPIPPFFFLCFIRYAQKMPKYLYGLAAHYLKQFGILGEEHTKELVHVKKPRPQNIQRLVWSLEAAKSPFNLRGRFDAWDKTSALTILVLPLQQSNNTNTWKRDALDKLRISTFQNYAYKYPNVTNRPPKGPPCLKEALVGRSFVPQPYFSGFDFQNQVFVLVMQRVAGVIPTMFRSPRPGDRNRQQKIRAVVDQTVAIERALLTMYLCGISFQRSQRSDVLIHHSSGKVSIVNFSRADKLFAFRRNRSIQGMIAANSIPIIWDPPEWLTRMLKHPDFTPELIKEARIRQWMWSDRC